MFYPVYVELGDDTHAYSVVMPDFPGCFSAADKEQDLQRNIQEAVELYFEGEDLDIPKPSTIADLKNNADYDYDGVWMMADIDLTKLDGKTKRINISMPQNLLARIDKVAKNRSAFLAKAASERLEREQ